MKILFFSDIHGVAENLEKLLTFIEELKPDQLVLLGDALYHGPRNGVPQAYDGPHTASLLNTLYHNSIKQSRQSLVYHPQLVCGISSMRSIESHQAAVNTASG